MPYKKIPCDIYKGGDWCQPYIDYGYANGLVMVQRILGEQKFLKRLWQKKNLHESAYDESRTCEQVVKELYDVGFKNTKLTFPTRNK